MSPDQDLGFWTLLVLKRHQQWTSDNGLILYQALALDSAAKRSEVNASAGDLTSSHTTGSLSPPHGELHICATALPHFVARNLEYTVDFCAAQITDRVLQYADLLGRCITSQSPCLAATRV